MKQILTLIFCFALILSCMAYATDDSRSYSFELTINGKNGINAQSGDVLTVTVMLRRTDSAEASEMYAFQDEIRYNSEFLELVDGSVLMIGGVQTNDISLQGDERSFYVNYVSFGGGENWESDTLLGTFQMKVLSNSGSATLISENCRVSLSDGSDSYAVTTQDVTVIVSADCTVRFDPQNGEEPTEMLVTLGDKLTPPANPTRDGYTFTGWHRDKSLAELWDFENSTVTGNMTLYGGWSDGDAAQTSTTEISASRSKEWVLYAALAALLLPAVALILLILRKKTVCFDSRGGAPVRTRKVRKGETMRRPAEPKKDGCRFVGWYTDSACTKEWNFARGRVNGNMTLYAKWEDQGKLIITKEN